MIPGSFWTIISTNEGGYFHSYLTGILVNLFAIATCKKRNTGWQRLRQSLLVILLGILIWKEKCGINVVGETHTSEDLSDIRKT